jgi:endonuclease I
MFDQWSADDPVSPWEKQREARIFDHTFIHNPFMQGVIADPAGACSWE